MAFILYVLCIVWVDTYGGHWWTQRWCHTPWAPRALWRLWLRMPGQPGAASAACMSHLYSEVLRWTCWPETLQLENNTAVYTTKQWHKRYQTDIRIECPRGQEIRLNIRTTQRLTFAARLSFDITGQKWPSCSTGRPRKDGTVNVP